MVGLVAAVGGLRSELGPFVAGADRFDSDPVRNALVRPPVIGDPSVVFDDFETGLRLLVTRGRAAVFGVGVGRLPLTVGRPVAVPTLFSSGGAVGLRIPLQFR